MNTTLAVDPGLSGGLAWTEPDGDLHAVPMPVTEGDLVDLLRSLAARGVRSAVVEDVGGWGMPGPRAFTFGRGFGFLLGALQTLSFSIVLVRPAKWQKVLSLGNVKSHGGKGPWKRHLLAEAQRRYPTCDVTLKTADALLLLSYNEKGQP